MAGLFSSGSRSNDDRTFGEKLAYAFLGPTLGAYVTGNSPSSSHSSSSKVDEDSNRDLAEYFSGLLTSAGAENDLNREYNAEQAQINRDWLTEMSNTSYQRAVADMQKAGLNPILAFSQGGASTPSGSSASYNVGGGDTLSSLINSFSNLISSATDVLSLTKSISSAGTDVKVADKSSKKSNYKQLPKGK